MKSKSNWANYIYTLFFSFRGITIIMLVGFVTLCAADVFNPRVQYYRSQIEDSTLTRNTKIEYFDSLLATHPADRPYLLFSKAQALRLNGHLAEALKTYKEAFATGTLLKEHDRLECQYAIGTILNDLGKPIESMTEITKLMAYPKPDSLKFYNVKGWLTIYNVYMQFGNTQVGLEATQTGLKELEQYKAYTPSATYRALLGALQIMQGTTNTNLGNYKEAYENFKDAEKIIDHKTLGILNLSRGLLYSEMKEHDIAGHYYVKALEDSLIDPKNRLSATVNHIVNLVDLKRYDDALGAVDKYATILEDIKGTPEEYKLWSIISEAYEGKKEWQLALEYRNRSVTVKDSTHSEEIRSNINHALTKIESLSARDDNAADNRTDRTLMWVFVGIAIAACGTGCWLLIRYRQAQKAAAVTGQELEETERELARLTGIEKEKEHMSQELTICKARLTHIDSSMGELRKLAANPKNHKAEIVSAVEKATRSLSSDAHVWEPFMAYAEGGSKEFFDKLYRLHPDLSNSETRMCAFILLGRTTKEIAVILNRSPRTVESIKYSLRVKLRIKDMTTEQYLRKISATPLDELLTGV